ncbi:MAG: helix-hairpin-helix domain-containing protein [Myxococcota bacterium]
MRGGSGQEALERLQRLEVAVKLLRDGAQPIMKRIDELETKLERVDQALSAVGRLEILSTRVEELEETLLQRFEVLEARGDSLERRMQSSGAGSDLKGALAELRREFGARFAEESAAQPWRDEVAELRQRIDASPQRAMEERVAALEASNPDDGRDFEAMLSRIAALEAQSELATLEPRLDALELERTSGQGTDLASLLERVTRLEAASAAAPASPPAPASTTAPAPAATTAATPATASDEAREDLTQVKGIGAKYAEKLYALGVLNVAAIARWGDEEIAKIASDLRTSEKRVATWRGNAAAHLASKS